MKELISYVEKNIERGACTCGKCVDAPDNPKQKQPNGHTANLMFFKVKNLNAQKNALKELITSHFPELLDGKEHNYIEIGGMYGGVGQDFALKLMGLGKIVGLWDLLTPETMMPFLPDELKMQMAGQGMVAVKSD